MDPGQADSPNTQRDVPTNRRGILWRTDDVGADRVHWWQVEVCIGEDATRTLATWGRMLRPVRRMAWDRLDTRLRYGTDGALVRGRWDSKRRQTTDQTCGVERGVAEMTRGAMTQTGMK